MARDLVNSRELAWRLFVRDISAQYRQSILGEQFDTRCKALMNWSRKAKPDILSN
jgi:hypothetical protein